jgi:hypothetical protein
MLLSTKDNICNVQKRYIYLFSIRLNPHTEHLAKWSGILLKNWRFINFPGPFW